MEFECLGPSGYGLSVSEKAGLEMAMTQIRLAEKLPLGSLSYWGRITGDRADYLVVVGTVAASTKETFPKKTFYYTTTNAPHKLSRMPVLDEAFKALAKASAAKPFSGDPSTPVDEENTNEEGVPVFREEHRLAYNAAVIDTEATVVPRGAYAVDARHRVVKANFGGLPFEAAGQLSSYYHFRPPTSPHALQALEKPGLVRVSDFLDPLTDDRPDGAWALSYDPSKQMVCLRSLYHLGAFFFHLIGTDKYGNVYSGDGTPNLDLPFML